MTWSIGTESQVNCREPSAGRQYTLIMSASPPKETEVEQGDPSPDNSDHNMDRGDPDAQARDLTFEFEVKEQDRWLPIANGWFSVHRQLPIIVRMP